MATTQVSLPSYREPPLDINGQWSRAWWRFFESVSKVIGPGQTPDLSAIIAAIADLRTQVQDQAVQETDPAIHHALTAIEEIQARMIERHVAREITAKVQELEEWMMGLPTPNSTQFALKSDLSLYALLSGATFTGNVNAPKFQTDSGSAIATTGTATTVYTLPNIVTPATYLVTANIGQVADAVNYGAFAVVMTDTGSARIAMQNNAANQSISLSGLAVRSTQSSGTTQTIFANITRIG
ncbi:hypothetical protein K6V90_09375 [Cupriavidus pauculus]|uniref:hypothetical protein n=1 Tax=Cupriavidus pauculus TaxID=82633 RepID=UPI001C936BFB|nr:hypothetical protein [Cupriavidus pauculus]MBY4730741.1 hypothetical protein [Cupriavidus pauculus]